MTKCDIKVSGLYPGLRGLQDQDETADSGREWTSGVNVMKLFSSSLTTRPNKLEGLPLVALSSWVLEFEGKARANPIGGPFRCFHLG